jgi:hypothetical protein
MRALENGDSEEASRAKVRVEDRNRALLAARRKKGEAYAPAWFNKRTRSIANDGTVPDGFDDLSFTHEEPFGVPSSPVSSPASEKKGRERRNGASSTEGTRFVESVVARLERQIRRGFREWKGRAFR